MTDDEIREFVGRLERAVDFRSAKSHVEELAISDYLRIRANRDACFSLASALLMQTIEAKNRTELFTTADQMFEGHDQVMCGLSSKMIADVQLFNDWENLESAIRQGRKRDYASDRLSLVGCALFICIVLVPAAGFIAWLLGQV